MTDIEDVFGDAADAPKTQNKVQAKKSEPLKETAQVKERDYAAEYDELIGDVSFRKNSVYPEIKPLNGFEQRWVRVFKGTGEYDAANVQNKKNKGFIPRPIESIPLSEYNWQSDTRNVDGSRGALGVNDMILMHRKISIGDKVRAEKEKIGRERGHEKLTKAKKQGGIEIEVEAENNAMVVGRKLKPADDE